MLQGLAKPVVLTGAQLPISEPRSDARENLITALEIASAIREGVAVVPEVCLYFDDALLRGNRSKKVESMHFDAFESGNYPPLAKAGVAIDYNQAAIHVANPAKEFKLRNHFDTNITILKLFPGITDSAVQAILQTNGLKALIIETFGAGNAPSARWLIQALKEAIQRGMIVLNVSQCPGGMVDQGRYETSHHLKEIGVLSGKDMTTEAAVAKLMILLGEHGIEKTKELLSIPLAGEITI
jgi:L-asparaginase